MEMKGVAISFEGGEGSGKSTIIKALSKYIDEHLDTKCICTREPGGARISEQIREIIVSKDNKEICSETEALLFAAARAQFMHEIVKPNLDEGNIVLIDRFIDSSLVYQGIGRNLGVDRVLNINDFATNGWLPNITIVLDIEPSIGLKRIADNNRETNRLDEEDISFYENVRNGYLEMASKFPERIKVVDANRPVEEILKDIIDILKI